MKHVPHLLLALGLALAPFAARAGECEDDYSECKEDCLIQYGGSIRVEVKKKYEKCVKKCSKVARRCTERQMETKANDLDEGALDGAPTSDQVDSDGMPTRDPGSKKKKVAPIDHDDDLRHDAPAHQGEELPADEVPKSSRTSLKTDEKSGPPPEPKKKSEAPGAEKVAEKPADAPADEPAPIRMTPKKDDSKSPGDDLRDDGPREEKPAEEEPPPRRRREKPKEPPPKKEEDHDDLRYY